MVYLLDPNPNPNCVNNIIILITRDNFGHDNRDVKFSSFCQTPIDKENGEEFDYKCRQTIF